MKKGYKDLLAEAEAVVRTLSPDQAMALHGRDDVQFVDLRDVRELDREGRIPGAFHAPRGMLEFWVDPESPYYKPAFEPGRRFVFFCASGWRSALAARTVMDMGMQDVAHIAGGFTAWRAAGGPVDEPVAAGEAEKKGRS